MDKLGDLVLSLSVDEHPALRGRRVHWLVTKGLGFIPAQAAPKRLATEFKRGFSPFEFFRLVKWLQRQRPQTVILLHNPWWVSCAMWWARVPERIGRQSQWHSFLFLNVPIRQKRSLADRHESDFNFDLVELGMHQLGLRRTFNLSQVKRSYLRLVAPNPFGTVESRGLKANAYRIVHPGMAGSALNWPQSLYRELIETLAREAPVVITGTKADQKYLSALTPLKGTPGVHWLVGELTSPELLDLLSQARAVIAPSTGVLHLAASLGAPSLGLYSPRRVEHPRRWGPKGINAGYLVPGASDSDMIAPTVMEQITVAQVLNTLREMEKAPHDSEAQPRI